MEIANILSSSAKIEVLNILCKDPSPVRIRALERRTGLAIRSVQVALSHLVEAKVVIRTTKDKSPAYYLNQSHKSYRLIKNIFKAIELEGLARRSEIYHSRAKRTFQFISEASELFNRARS